MKFSSDISFSVITYSETIMRKVLGCYKCPWDNRSNDEYMEHYCHYVSKTIDGEVPDEICKAVCLLMVDNTFALNWSSVHLRERKVDTFEKMREQLALTVIKIFKNCYNPKPFLELCALFCGVTLSYFHNNEEDFSFQIASLSAQMLAYVINLFFLQNVFDINKDWFLLRVHANLIRREIREKRRVDEDIMLKSIDFFQQDAVYNKCKKYANLKIV